MIGRTEPEIAKVTFGVAEGTFTVRGTSSVGETFRICLAEGTYLKSISVEFSTQIDNNDHVLFLLPAPFGSSVLNKIFPMSNVGQYAYTVDFPDKANGSGLYEVYSGTSVQGSSPENVYALAFVIAR